MKKKIDMSNKIKENKGVTLISLVVTTVILVILATVSISIFEENGLVEKAEEVKFKTEMEQIKDEYEIYVLQRSQIDLNFDINTLNMGSNLLLYNTKEDENKDIYDVLKNSDKKYLDNIDVIKGKLYYTTENENEAKWAKELGFEPIPYEIVDGVLLSANTNLELLDDGTGTLVIPGRVTTIGEGSFAGVEGIKKVIIPSTVKEIKENAFRGNTTLEEVVFETRIVDGVEQGVEIIGNLAFMECTKLASIEIPNTVKEIKIQAFYYCTSLKTVKLSNSLEYIPAWGFSGCAIENITIPEGIKRIVDSGFENCTNLKVINLPTTLNSIGASVFGRCSSLEEINIAEGNENFASENGILFNKDKTKMIYVAKAAINENSFTIPNTVTNLTGGLIEIHPEIEYIYIPSSVTNINVNFFLNNKNIVSVEIDSNNENFMSENGMIYNKDKTILHLYYLNSQNVDLSKESIKTIKTNAFYMCSNIETVIFPESLERIESQAFSRLNKLNSVLIGKNVNYIDPLAFYVSRNITNMTIDSENPYYTIENNTIFNKDKTKLVTVLNTVTEYTIPEGVVTIGGRAFHNQSQLAEIKISETVKIIEDSFNYCSSLKQIDIPSNVEKISTMCFNNSNKLEKIIVHKEEGSISGSPWGCTIGTRAVEWVP